MTDDLKAECLTARITFDGRAMDVVVDVDMEDASQVSMIGFPMAQIRDVVDHLYVVAHTGKGEYQHE